MEHYTSYSESTALSTLSFIAIGALVISIVCVVMIIPVCCYNLFFSENEVEWQWYLMPFTPSPRDNIRVINPAIEFSRQTESVHLLAPQRHHQWRTSEPSASRGVTNTKGE